VTRNRTIFPGPTYPAVPTPADLVRKTPQNFLQENRLTDEELDELEHTHPNHIPRSLCRRAVAEIRRARAAGLVVCK